VEKRTPTSVSSETFHGLIAIALAAALWAAAAAVARRLFDDGVDPLELVQARALLSVAGLALVPAAWRKPAGAGDIRRVIALGLCIALVNAAYYIAIQRLAVAVAIVLQYLGPALVVLWTAATLKRNPSREVLFGVLIAFIGVVLVSELPSGNLGGLDGIGIAAGLASAVMFAAYTILAERVAASYGVQGALLRGFAAASVFWVLFQSFRGWPEELFTRDHLPLVLFVGLIGTLVPFLLYLWGIERVRAERASIAATLEPVLVALIAWLWLGQALSAMQLIGGALIVGAVLSLQIRRPQAVLVPEP
jgi:drug/metabolite transporter (DMT)-like permease